ncbi:MAG TPA: outer membrane beta-barrel domain-containing protein [Gammaproteobacteria bacterium]|nr:outer membrane beta-barrel domain-containing protein [Gammaproteobacteria bacterium]
MESRLGIFLLKSISVLTFFSVLSGCSLLRVDDAPYEDSEPVIKPELERRTITEADIDSEDFEAGVFVGVMSIEDFGSNVVYGGRLAYHITEDFFTEAAIGRTKADKTSFEDLSGGAEILSDSQRELTYYNISLGYNILPGEAFIGKGHAYNSALYVIAGIGNTDFADDNHFTVNVGAGYRFLLTDWIALRADFRDHIFDSDLLGKDKTTHNLEATAGISFFF